MAARVCVGCAVILLKKGLGGMSCDGLFFGFPILVCILCFRLFLRFIEFFLFQLSTWNHFAYATPTQREIFGLFTQRTTTSWLHQIKLWQIGRIGITTLLRFRMASKIHYPMDFTYETGAQLEIFGSGKLTKTPQCRITQHTQKL